MKLELEHEGHSVTMEDETIVDICEAIDFMEQALIAVGYDPQRIHGALVVKARQIQEELDID